jgi:ABC-type lipoprotein export system ATPase subunit
MAFLEARAITKSYTVGSQRLMVLRDLELAVEAGEMVAIVGASGVGKSTLLHVLGGLDAVDGGAIAIDGINLTQLADGERVAFRNRHVGFVFQFHHLLPEFTAVENAEMPMRIARRGVSEARTRAGELLQRVGLGERLTHRPGMLSGGEQQRVAVARALIGRPAVVFADEPTGNLDSVSSQEILSLLRHAVDEFGQTIVMVTHDPRAAAIADRIVFLADGRVVDDMTGMDVEDILDRLKALA